MELVVVVDAAAVEGEEVEGDVYGDEEVGNEFEAVLAAAEVSFEAVVEVEEAAVAVAAVVRVEAAEVVVEDIEVEEALVSDVEAMVQV